MVFSLFFFPSSFGSLLSPPIGFIKMKKGIDPNERNVCKQKHESGGRHTDKLTKTTSTYFKQTGNLRGNAVPRCGDYDKVCTAFSYYASTTWCHLYFACDSFVSYNGAVTYIMQDPITTTTSRTTRTTITTTTGRERRLRRGLPKRVCRVLQRHWRRQL